MNKYWIGTGHHVSPHYDTAEFRKIWKRNTLKYASPERIMTIESASSPIVGSQDWIALRGDIGSLDEIYGDIKPYPYPGSFVAVCTLALLAYQDESDFIFKEQDCLAFGKWPEQLYADLGASGMVIGRAVAMPCAVSLILMKHWFIPTFVSWYLSSPSEKCEENLIEHKMARWQQQQPDLIKYNTFGYDRDRPFNADDPVWYGQKFTRDDLAFLANKGLI